MSAGLTRSHWGRRRAVGLVLGLAVLLVSCRSAPPPTSMPPVLPRGTVEEPLPEPAQPLDRQEPSIDQVIERPVELVVRVGLLTDQPAARFPCCRGLQAEWEDRTLSLSDGLTVTPAPAAVSPPVFRLQVAALKDEGQAEQLAHRLAGLSGQPASVVLDAETGLHRVRVGRYATREEAEADARVLSTHGVAGAWVTSENGVLQAPALLLRHGAMAMKIPGRWLAVAAGADESVPVAGRRFRGRVLIFLNDRGSLNIVNELPLEAYLRGVVPVEMGPDAYPEVEALKAQAVAARTYTVRNLREFEAEGFDICATPRCQVYEGIAAEHPRSDRAVAETAGEVLIWGDRPIDALYSSTCGGHTENVEVVFPLKRELVYLEGVPCLESGVRMLRGGLPRGSAFPDEVTRRFLPVTRVGAAGLGDRLDALARAAGIVGAGDEGSTPSDLQWPAVSQYLARRFDLALDPRLLGTGEELEGLLAASPPEWNAGDRRLGALFLDLQRRAEGQRELSSSGQEELLFGLAEYLGLVTIEDVRFLDLEKGELVIRGPAGSARIPLPNPVPTFRLEAGRWRAGSLSMAPGDTIRLVRRGSELLGLLQTFEPTGAAEGASGKWRSWRRFRSESQLAELVGQRYPGFSVRSLEVLDRGVSGRVGRLLMVASDGREEIVEGLAIRWTLDLPDTLFEVRRTRSSAGTAGWLFTGRGWGHGVGLCQIGSFGMAVRGHDYRDILSYYYRGAELARVSGRWQIVRQSG